MDVGLMKHVEQISRQPNLQSVAWTLLLASSRMYCEKWEFKIKWNNLKNFAGAREEATVELGPIKFWPMIALLLQN